MLDHVLALMSDKRGVLFCSVPTAVGSARVPEMLLRPEAASRSLAFPEILAPAAPFHAALVGASFSETAVEAAWFSRSRSWGLPVVVLAAGDVAAPSKRRSSVD
eukprot:11185809-Alexandrium_andersonii.AAC.1